MIAVTARCDGCGTIAPIPHAGPTSVPMDTLPPVGCREHPEIDWIPDRIANPSAMVDRAREVCAECAELLPCLMHAVRARERGIWGGTTDAERRATCQRGGDRCM